MIRPTGLILILLLAAAGCQTGKTSDKVLVYIDPPDARSALRGPGAWVDPRPRREYETGHIPGAIHLPFASVGEGHIRLTGQEPIIVYGDDYNDAIAVAMSKRLIELGHEDVRTLRGGLRAWQAAGGEVVTGAE